MYYSECFGSHCQQGLLLGLTRGNIEDRLFCLRDIYILLELELFDMIAGGTCIKVFAIVLSWKVIFISIGILLTRFSCTLHVLWLEKVVRRTPEKYHLMFLIEVK